MDKRLPRAGDQVTTPEGHWLVKELILLGRQPLHYAVRVVHTDDAGHAMPLLMSTAEWLRVLARVLPPDKPGRRRDAGQRDSGRNSVPGRGTRR
ncbi:hypothetical protein D3C71_24330 [compost metagenome]